MPSPLGELVLRGLRADAADLAALLATDGCSGSRLCAAAAELGELVGAHARTGGAQALGSLAPDPRTRGAALLRDLLGAADGLADAATVAIAAGLSEQDREAAQHSLTRRVSALAAALAPPELVDLLGTLPADAPGWLVLGSALRRAAEDDVPDAWRISWEGVRPDLERSVLHRALGRPTTPA